MRRTWIRCSTRYQPSLSGLAAGVFVATLAMLDAHDAGHVLDPLGVALAALACFPLSLAADRGLSVFAVSAGASALLELLGYHLRAPVAPAFALVLVARDPRTRDCLGLTAAVVVGLLLVYVGAAAAGQPNFSATSVLGVSVWWGGAWIGGEQMRQRRQRVAELRERAERTRRDRQREQQLAVAEERNRIARDLHDSAAHAINVILVQAGAARLLQERDPDAARKALNTIEDVARETIGEIDTMIRGLRDRNGTVEPPAGLAAVRTLAERHRANGLDTDIQLEGVERPLSPGLDQTAYRIVQESLTNAARYGTGRAAVRIGYGRDELEISVSNPSSGAAAPIGGGHGIVGMRERAELLGGSLVAEARGDRFVVHATLPY